MTIFAQLPGTEEAIRQAVPHGYEAVVLVIILLGGMALFAFLVRMWVTKSNEREDTILSQAAEREQRMGNRLNEVEAFIRTSLMEALKESTRATLLVSSTMADQSRSLAELDSSFKLTMHDVGEQLSRVAESLLRIENQLAEHDSKVIENVARAASLKAKALENA